MLPNTIAELLRLPKVERVELAMALWESLEDPEQAAEFDLTPELTAELDRRMADHVADPSTAIPWQDVKRKLAGEN